MPLMYETLAEWWPLLSAPDEYEEEAAVYRQLFRDTAARPVQSILELGSGGGNNASHLKTFAPMTLVEPEPGMRAVSQALNPECEHLTGDMRSVRLGRQFDVVFVHDAICYMTSVEDLRAALTTAAVHCAPGGAVLLAPDFVKETFTPGTSQGGHDAPDGRGLRYLEWSWDPDPRDSTCLADYALLLRESDGTVRAEHDRHVEGLFSRRVWLDNMHAAGFRSAAAHVTTFSDDEPLTVELFVARMPEPPG